MDPLNDQDIKTTLKYDFSDKMLDKLTLSKN